VFSPDGSRLLSTVAEGRGPWTQTVFDASTGKTLSTNADQDNVVIAAAFSPDGRWVATGGGDKKEIQIWDPSTGRRRLGPDGHPLSLAGHGTSVWAIAFASDGARIAWGTTFANNNSAGRRPLEYELRLPGPGRRLGEPERLERDDGFIRTSHSHGLYSIVSRRAEPRGGDDAILDVTFNAKVIAGLERGPRDGYEHRAYTLSADGMTIVSGGGGGMVQRFDLAAIEAAALRISNHVLKGEELAKVAQEFAGHTCTVPAIASSVDGRFLVSGSCDQTVRIWNLKTRELLCHPVRDL
jgi:WD40 repeat protein